ncbi:FKBP-type peptidyl-prolyl cis-trans isomerase SlpA [Ferrimonas sediminum]|uniref:Peptidyl-prolyl cis-trans isomerase n=1 Tax=Ferrimonas sediminum TaxID=718193 RepID=A0A1G8ZBI9_9GAMM|nr:FKBP-type peptidyl-prolyl cis-trans isomerase [Ferrimonas sediminum]SDK12441.1 FKBP-type peptidyl-prolyl cis-trans isomerase SlpA [Ferrimonas sediminum]
MSQITIGSNSQVFVHFDVELPDGTVADSTRAHGKPARLTLGDGSLSGAFEAAIKGMEKGEKRRFSLDPQHAFGERNPDNIHHLDRTQFAADADLSEGTIMAFDTPDGNQVPGVIRELAGDSVTVDFNHPLAGQTVIFDLEVLDIVIKD